jgi:hypothetical protein
MHDERRVTIDGWKTALLDEVLFRAACTLSDRGSPDGSTTVEAELRVLISATPDGDLLLRMDSLVDGPVVAALTAPF